MWDSLGGGVLCLSVRVSRADSVTVGVWCCVHGGVIVCDTVLKSM